MKDIYSSLTEYQEMSNDDLVENLNQYKTLYDELYETVSDTMSISDKVTHSYYYGYRKYKNYKDEIIKNIILNHNDIFYKGMLSFMEIKNRKLNDESLNNKIMLEHMYFNYQPLKSVDMIYDFLIYNTEEKIIYINSLLDIALCDYLLFDNDFIDLMVFFKNFDAIIYDDDKKMIDYVIKYLKTQGHIGQQLIMEYKLSNKNNNRSLKLINLEF